MSSVFCFSFFFSFVVFFSFFLIPLLVEGTLYIKLLKCIVKIVI